MIDLADALKRSVEAAKKEAAKPKPPARARSRATPASSRAQEGGMSAVRTDVGSVLEQLERRQPKMVLTVDSYQLPVTNLDKVLWPGAGRSKPLTKRDLLRYLTRVLAGCSLISRAARFSPLDIPTV